MKPLFIFSLPRSGSTLLQRLLLKSHKIATSAEPWILLPLLSQLRSTGILADYSQQTASVAITEFLKDKEEHYKKAVRMYAMTLYGSCLENNEMYFLDKTPRYYNIIKEIISTFPDAKFIILLRDLYDISNSIFNTWCNNKLTNMFRYERDIITGSNNLLEASKILGSNSYVCKYEELVLNPQDELLNICEYLDIQYTDEMLEPGKLEGKMGDPTRDNKYDGISEKSVGTTTKSNSIIKNRYLAKLFSQINNEYFNEFTYSKDALLEKTSQSSMNLFIILKDLVDLLKLKLIKRFKLHLKFASKLKWFKDRFMS